MGKTYTLIAETGNIVGEATPPKPEAGEVGSCRGRTIADRLAVLACHAERTTGIGAAPERPAVHAPAPTDSANIRRPA